MDRAPSIPAPKAKLQSPRDASMKTAKRKKDDFKFPFCGTQFKGILSKRKGKNNLSQQLVFQPVPGDSEINEGGLSLQFWLLERHDYLFVTVQRSSGSVTAHANANRSLLNNEFIPLSSLHEPK
ncbi:hypothetical protein HGM15179_008667 [Zosterops borbonicus]|uniref:Uncharacterized protein n=1 Tax=Zosterops borbonicus TaxID=364589 RepID=A0A8K1GGH8_9PASS|nr:hypothetical protein HGM15179_008667 [Zosterops borbonicus]